MRVCVRFYSLKRALFARGGLLNCLSAQFKIETLILENLQDTRPKSEDLRIAGARSAQPDPPARRASHRSCPAHDFGVYLRPRRCANSSAVRVGGEEERGAHSFFIEGS